MVKIMVYFFKQAFKTVSWYLQPQKLFSSSFSWCWWIACICCINNYSETIGNVVPTWLDSLKYSSIWRSGKSLVPGCEFWEMRRAHVFILHSWIPEAFVSGILSGKIVKIVSSFLPIPETTELKKFYIWEISKTNFFKWIIF